MQKWEYKVVWGPASDNQLNELGSEGWELVAAIAAGLEEKYTEDAHPALNAYRVYLYFKRPK